MSLELWKQLFEKDYSPTPIVALFHPILEKNDVELFLKLDYLNHPLVSGNKLRKLKYPLLDYLSGNYEGIVSYGGAFSNHLHALAYACQVLQIPSIGVVRGEELSNPTLDFCKSQKMNLLFESRTLYRNKEVLYQKYQTLFPNHYHIPEGGSTLLATKGCKELMQEIHQQESFDEIIVAAGTGTTAAGISKALLPHQQLRIISVLKGFSIKEEIEKNLGNCSFSENIVFHDEAVFGGYAQRNIELEKIIEEFCTYNSFPLDPIYVGKMLATTLYLIDNKTINPNSKLLAIHTGGAQGILPYCDKYGLNPKQFGIGKQ